MTLIFELALFPTDTLQTICDHIEVLEVMRLWVCGAPLLQQKLIYSVRNVFHFPSRSWPYIECACLSLPPFLNSQSLTIISTGLPTKTRRLELEKLSTNLINLKIHSFRAFDLLSSNLQSKSNYLGLKSILPSLLHIDIEGEGLCNALLEHLPENLETLIFSDYSFTLEDTTPLENLPNTLRVAKLQFTVNSSMKPRKPLPNLTELYLIFQVSRLGDWVSILPATLTSLHITKTDDLMRFEELPKGLLHFSYIGPFYPISGLPLGIESVQLAHLTPPQPQDVAQFGRGIRKLSGFVVSKKMDLALLPPCLTDLEMTSTIAKPEVHQFQCKLIRLQILMERNLKGLIEVPFGVTHLSLYGFEHTQGYRYPDSIVLMQLTRVPVTTELIQSLPTYLTVFSLTGSSYDLVSSQTTSHQLPRTLTKLVIRGDQSKGPMMIELPSSLTDLRMTLASLSHHQNDRRQALKPPPMQFTPLAANLKIVHISCLGNHRNASPHAPFNVESLRACQLVEELHYQDAVPIPIDFLSNLAFLPLLASLSLRPLHPDFTFDLIPKSITHLTVRCARNFDLQNDIFLRLPPFTRHLILDSNPNTNLPLKLNQMPPQLCRFTWNSEDIF